MLSEQDNIRYSRHLLLDEIGVMGQEKLKKSKVLIVGAGGLGCPVLLYLAAAGVGTIGIIDFDIIEESNLQRQILFDTDDIGKRKAQVAKEKLSKKNPLITIVAYNEKLTNKNSIELFNDFDLIIDGTDNFATRYMINDACVLTQKPLVYGAIHKFEGQVSVFNYCNGPNYRCLFPIPPANESIPTCSEVGVLGVLPGIIGAQQANEALKIILDIGEVISGKLLIYNALTTSFSKIEIPNTSNKKVQYFSSVLDFENFNYDLHCASNQYSLKQISNIEFTALPPETIVLDVRETWEEPQLQHKKILRIPLASLPNNAEKIPKEEVVYVVCQKGGRSRAAIDLLIKEFDFKNLINVSNGIQG
ncbi:MAG: molybdopterin-synthase adenylyltransferase MoeB [Crocinitomicaceae bacterium]|nr:molybdopterin-synthase adenylyltransferase MoeB [Crocinitomicaceae bacterium]